MAENDTVTYTVSIAMEIPAPPRSAEQAVLEFWRRLRSDDGNEGCSWRFDVEYDVEYTDERGTEACFGPVVLGVPDIRRFEDRYQQAASRAGNSSHDAMTDTAQQIDSTAEEDTVLIAYAREHGACVYEWPGQSNTRSLYALPNGTGMYIESQWGGGRWEPWTLSYACPISAGDLEQEIARYNEGMEYEGKIGFINPFAPNTDQPIDTDTEDAPARPHVHYHYGSGMCGCLYDYGPEISTSIDEAVDDLATVFDLDDSQRRELTERRFIALGGGYGADYADITPCNNPECPDYLSYVRQFAGQPLSKKGA